MILLSTRQLSRQFDVEPVFRDVTFDVRPGDRIGLVGPNGAGKTTLLNILCGRDQPDGGTVLRHGSAEVALLEQQADFPPGRTLLEEARSGLEHLYRLQRDALATARAMAGESDQQALNTHKRRYDRLQQELERHDAYAIDHRVDEVLHGLGFTTEEYHRPLEQFSGGQRSRVLLARLLLRDPDVMLLDEPTNHLDIAATEWLESFLSRSGQAMILVSHDRYFLDKVTNRTFELHAGRLTDYPGGFSEYCKLRAERRKVTERTRQRQQEQIARAEEFIRRNKYGQKHAQAADREKKIERMDRVQIDPDFETASMHFGSPSRTGDWVIDAQHVTKGFGEPLFSDFSLTIERGERVGILGANGSGKTTLLRTLIGQLEPDAGTVRLGTGLNLGYFDQELACLDADSDAVEAVRPAHNPDLKPGELRSLLARFGIRGELALQKVGLMSGGEKSRVALARLAAAGVNVLVLDEPTNHLDLWARDSLEKALTDFAGTVLFVSHDRYFVDRVATRVVVLEPDRFWIHEGNYSVYTAFRRSLDSPPAQTDTGTRPAPAGRRENEKRPRRQRRFPYRKADEIEADIHRHEQRLAELETDLGDPWLHRDGQRVKQLAEEYDRTKAELEGLYQHWEEALELN